jgi:hypothetical protein
MRTNPAALLLVAAISLSNAAARIGESEEECNERYGKQSYRQETGNGIVTVGYNKGAIAILIRLLDGKAVYLFYSKFNDADDVVPFSAEETSALLATHGTPDEWGKSFKDPRGINMYINFSKRVAATVDAKREGVQIVSMDYSESQAGKNTSSPSKDIEGL